jgi:hypothetical protein
LKRIGFLLLSNSTLKEFSHSKLAELFRFVERTDIAQKFTVYQYTHFAHFWPIKVKNSSYLLRIK